MFPPPAAGGTSIKTSFCDEVRNEILNYSEKSNSFLQEAFLRWGTITDPHKEYNLEFTPPGKDAVNIIINCLKSEGFSPKTSIRKGKTVIYIKDNEKIADFLTMVGATKSMFKLLEIKIEKEARGNANRKANCDTANMERLAYAAAVQIADIQLIERVDGLYSLPIALRETAKLRLENPDASLSELCELSDKKISRSGLNHRLQKLRERARQLTNNN